MLVVQNQKAGLNEFNVAAALMQLGLTYVFHPVVDGVTDGSKGASVDFLVGTSPKSTPLIVFKVEDADETAYILKEDSTILKNKDWYPMVEVEFRESMTVEDALAALRRELMI